MTNNKEKKGLRSSLIEQYRSAFLAHGDSPAGVLWPRGRQALRFNALTQHFSGNDFSILDYGCGLAHLKTYLDQHFDRYQYYGADLVPDFVETVTLKYPDVAVQLVKSYEEIIAPVDHVVISGTFNIIDASDGAEYLEYVQAALLHLFNLARVSLSVNFMTDRVDFIQDQALHVNVSSMVDFARTHLSSRLRVDESYMPYEFTLVILKDNEIIRPDNVYRQL